MGYASFVPRYGFEDAYSQAYVEVSQGAPWHPEDPRAFYWQQEAATAQRREAAEVRLLEAELHAARTSPLATWLRGPVTCIEHEVVRRRYAAKVQELQEKLLDAQRRFAAAAAGAPPPPRPPTVAWGPQINDPPEVVAPSEVVVERKRLFGDRPLRLWVEDVPFRGGARVHAMDATSFVRSVVELSDMDIQVMFDAWWQRTARSRQAALADGDPLREFLLCLLDASYFELDGIGQLQLRVPSAVPPLPPVPDKELIEILSYKASPHSSETLTKEWIRDKLLVPKSVVSSSSSSKPRAGYPAYAKPRSCSARRGVQSSQTRQSSRPSSASRSAARSSSSGPVPRWSVSDAASHEGSFFNDSSEKPSSTRCPIPTGGLRLRRPLEEREKGNLPYRVTPSAPQSAEPEAKPKKAQPAPHQAPHPAPHPAQHAAPHAAAHAAPHAAPHLTPHAGQHPATRRARRPASAKIHKHKRVAEPEEDIIYEDVEGPHMDREISAASSSADAQAPETERPISVPMGELPVAQAAVRHHRAWRPASAKVHKHKRVMEHWENAEDIYDDLEPSLAESSDFSQEEASPEPYEGAQPPPPPQGVDEWIRQENPAEATQGRFQFLAPRRPSPPSLDRRRKTA